MGLGNHALALCCQEKVWNSHQLFILSVKISCQLRALNMQLTIKGLYSSIHYHNWEISLITNNLKAKVVHMINNILVGSLRTGQCCKLTIKYSPPRCPNFIPTSQVNLVSIFCSQSTYLKLSKYHVYAIPLINYVATNFAGVPTTIIVLELLGDVK